MTTIYFVRHAQSNYDNHVKQTRERSVKGLQNRTLVTEYLSTKEINVVLSSMYKRAVDTVMPFAERQQLPVEITEKINPVLCS
ncbi:MAG: histidine phosphatase family protein [Lachnospiraceae bacterium]|nr:histidine phosphatase family protein [Lachnospiraceae bacterium]